MRNDSSVKGPPEARSNDTAVTLCAAVNALRVNSSCSMVYEVIFGSGEQQHILRDARCHWREPISLEGIEHREHACSPNTH